MVQFGSTPPKRFPRDLMEKQLSFWDRRKVPTAIPSDHRKLEHERETMLLRETLRTLSIENDALRSEVRDLRAQQEQVLDRLEQQAPQLQRLSSGHGQLQASLLNVHQKLVQTEQRLNGVYDSRIWRTLVLAGGLVERLIGKSRLLQPTSPIGSGAASDRVQSDDTPDFPYCLDEPMEGQVVYFHEMIVRGWVLFPLDQGRVEAAVDEQPWFEVA